MLVLYCYSLTTVTEANVGWLVIYCWLRPSINYYPSRSKEEAGRHCDSQVHFSVTIMKLHLLGGTPCLAQGGA